VKDTICLQSYLDASLPGSHQEQHTHGEKSLSKPGKLTAANEADARENFAFLGPFALAPEQKQMHPC